ncbi:MAG: RIP metalloprotease RseP [Flavobacteriales bacterium]|nr:RIP metalloprotease RseP [Flavobacteriales bacterium]
MEWVIRIGQFILSLSILVVLHEFGHYLPAKLFGTRVEKFFLFFDYKFALVKKKIGETVWGIGWIPFGGYVKIAGMVDESMDKDQMAQEPQPWEYRSKPAWQRLIIILGGVTVNIILAFVIYWMMMFVYGEKFLPVANMKDGIWVQNELVANRIGIQTGDHIIRIGNQDMVNFSDLNEALLYSGGKSVVVERNGEQITLNSPAGIDQDILASGTPLVVSIRMPFYVGGFSDEITNGKDCGLQVKDKIIGVDGTPIRYFDEFKTYVANKKGETIALNVLRNEQQQTLNCTVNDSGLVGLAPVNMSMADLEKDGAYEFGKIEYSFFAALPAGLNKTFSTLSGYIKQFKVIFTKQGAKQIGSLGTIMSMFPPEWNWQAFWQLTAFLSIILAFINVLPIPALDGGHAVFIIYELITGRKPSEKFLEKAQTVGMILLIGLMVYALGNDIWKFIISKFL